MNINDIITSCRVNGSHWFDPGTMRFFKCRVLPDVWEGPGGVYFVSSERGPHDDSPRTYTVRKFTPPSDISTVGQMGQYRSSASARHAASRAAGLKPCAAPTTSAEPHKVTDVEQFHLDLTRHISPTVTIESARKLVTLARQYDRLQCMRCGDGSPNQQANAEFAERRSPIVGRQIDKFARSIGATGTVLSGDPRGCCVKLVCPDGFTDDWGHEGMCVPIENR